MESGAIPDEKINASSEYNHTSHVARHARLRSTAGAWVAGISNGTNGSQWLQIDLGSQHQVSGVATQGKGADNQFVSSYNLQYSNDEVNFHFYKEQEEASNKVNYNEIHQIVDQTSLYLGLKKPALYPLLNLILFF